MAHFAEIGLNNKVIRVVVINDKVLLDSKNNIQESLGKEFLQNTLGGYWVQCSYNTWHGQHKNGGTPFRKNYPGGGYTYDEDRDAFIPPKNKKFPSWVLDEESCTWVPPIPLPEQGGFHEWNENNQSWDIVKTR
jgi:hypothetical protein